MAEVRSLPHGHLDALLDALDQLATKPAKLIDIVPSEVLYVWKLPMDLAGGIKRRVYCTTSPPCAKEGIGRDLVVRRPASPVQSVG